MDDVIYFSLRIKNQINNNYFINHTNAFVTYSRNDLIIGHTDILQFNLLVLNYKHFKLNISPLLSIQDNNNKQLASNSNVLLYMHSDIVSEDLRREDALGLGSTGMICEKIYVHNDGEAPTEIASIAIDIGSQDKVHEIMIQTTTSDSIVLLTDHFTHYLYYRI